jgi:Fic family protein
MTMVGSFNPEPVARSDAQRDLSRRIRAEYEEMPGLSVTLAQAQRLWCVDRQTCERVFTTLVEGGFLRRTTRDRFVRA